MADEQTKETAVTAQPAETPVVSVSAPIDAGGEAAPATAIPDPFAPSPNTPNIPNLPHDGTAHIAAQQTKADIAVAALESVRAFVVTTNANFVPVPGNEAAGRVRSVLNRLQGEIGGEIEQIRRLLA